MLGFYRKNDAGNLERFGQLLRLPGLSATKKSKRSVHTASQDTCRCGEIIENMIEIMRDSALSDPPSETQIETQDDSLHSVVEQRSMNAEISFAGRRSRLTELCLQ
jgi:hypothetical protein